MAELYYDDGSIVRYINRFPPTLENVCGCDNHFDEQYHLSWNQAVDWVKRYNQKYTYNYKLLEFAGDRISH